MVSIHPMCRFKERIQNKQKNRFPFQYILCVGSRDDEKEDLLSLIRFQYILCVGSSYVGNAVFNYGFRFQYILCVGSST